MNIPLVLSILSLLGTCIGYVVNKIYAKKLYNQTKAHHNSLLFAEYTRRYQEIMIQMPDSVFEGTAVASNSGVAKYMILYFDLCSEEFHLRSQGFIPDDVWNKWVEGMRLTVKSQIYYTSWQRLAYSFNSDFVHFMNHEILKK